MRNFKLIKSLGLSLLSGALLASCQFLGGEDNNSDGLTKYVDPYIGSGGHGHVFVGANVPFGAIQAGPSNFHKGWDWCSSYHYSDSIVKGFSHLHLSGTGCTDLGEFLIMPAVGELKIHPGSQEDPEKGYASYYSHDSEKVEPGYYKVHLDTYNVDIEMTTTERVALHQITYPKSDQSRLIIDLKEGNGDKATETFFHKVNDTIVAGYRFSQGWAADQREYFAMIISKPIDDITVFDGDNKKDGDAAKGSAVKAFLNFKTKAFEKVLVKFGMSPVSMENALANIKAEMPSWNFNEVLTQNKAKWNKELSKIEIKTKDESAKKVFYTAMYHTLIAPNLFNDANGDYRGVDKKVYDKANFTNYTLFSLWDTYRTAHPLYTLTQKDRVPDMINSMLAIYKQQGKLPVWHLRGNETNTMVGYSGVPVVVDACLKGFKGIDLELAYEAVKTTAMGDFEPGVKELQKYGYIPCDMMHESVASAMEYAISDWGISMLAEKLGKTEDAAYFKERAKAYQKYFDPKDKFMKGRMKNGSWRTPFDPYSAQHRVNDYCEGNAWQYLWLVPQDPEGLIKLLGGEKPFVAKLDSLFSISSDLEHGASADITGLIGQYAHGNEPSHHITYLYAYAGEQYKTADKVRYILNELYTDQPDGLCGNEDCGQMSAWYVMSSMGFYPVNPSNGAYVFGSPLFDEASIVLSEEKNFTIIAKNNSKKNIYIQSVKLNGIDYKKSFITHKDILKGGVLTFEMGEKPNENFGKNPQDRPKSIMY
ncbi:glycoside hydrolase family 92 protein [Marinifilum sp. N1E240]|uniref:GH92 family glycosyl hydrolase n=1 Tax=Marinifilum sp. N1E240 TaxID=2608082 RepID=UPI00128B764A|nr:GH92 family glycosyl hydrolase [Marinifilum sp. N1E240]MPQ46624.1 glycoside hydrolase family 92 protein [Marinifilum sp. N1E240]